MVYYKLSEKIKRLISKKSVICIMFFNVARNEKIKALKRGPKTIPIALIFVIARRYNSTSWILTWMFLWFRPRANAVPKRYKNKTKSVTFPSKSHLEIRRHTVATLSLLESAIIRATIAFWLEDIKMAKAWQRQHGHRAIKSMLFAAYSFMRVANLFLWR